METVTHRTERDEDDLAEADRLIHAGKALRQRVFARIRQRRWRSGKSE